MRILITGGAGFIGSHLCEKLIKKKEIKSLLVLDNLEDGEKKNLKFSSIKFAKLISKFSKTQVIIIKNFEEIKKYFKKNLTSDEIIIGMGAGLISKYMRELKTEL